MDQQDVLRKLSEFSDLLLDFGINNRNGKVLWDIKNELFENFKETRFDSREERQNAWDRFQSLVSELKEKQKEINDQNDEYAEQAFNKLDEIDRYIPVGGFFSSVMEKEDIIKARNKLNDYFYFIKKKQWPSKEKRELVWEKFNDLKDRLKQREDEHYSKKREKHNRRLEHSEELTKKIMDALHACDPDTPIEELFQIVQKLIEFIMTLGLAPLINAIFGIEEKPKHPLKQKSDAIKDVRKMIHDNLDELTREDKQKIFAELDRVNNALNQAWTDHKEEMRIKNEQWAERQKERAEKQRLWEKKQWDFINMLEDKINRKEKQKDDIEQIIQKQQDFLKRLDRNLDNQNDYLGKVKSQLEDLEDKYADARSDSYRDKVSEWMDQKKEKIEKVEEDIEGIESKKEEVEQSIRIFESKIESIEDDIRDMKNKIAEVKEKIAVA